VLLGKILPESKAASSGCATCGELTGQMEQCRTLIHQGREYETIPYDLIRQAVCRV
jgi:predicted RNA-binding Zn-ribbon protein involved in translation (DUF1610 family)